MGGLRQKNKKRSFLGDNSTFSPLLRQLGRGGGDTRMGALTDGIAAHGDHDASTLEEAVHRLVPTA